MAERRKWKCSRKKGAIWGGHFSVEQNILLCGVTRNICHWLVWSCITEAFRLQDKFMKFSSVSCVWRVGADQTFTYAVCFGKQRTRKQTTSAKILHPYQPMFCQAMLEHFHWREMPCRGWNTNSQKQAWFPQIYKRLQKYRWPSYNCMQSFFY